MGNTETVTAPIRFQAYTEPDESDPSATGDRTSAEAVTDAWIYLFKAPPRIDSVHFAREIYANADGKYQLVDLDAQKGKDDRPPTDKELDAVVLDTKERRMSRGSSVDYPLHYWMLYSPIQVPWSRLPDVGDDLRIKKDLSDGSPWLGFFDNWLSRRGLDRTYFYADDSSIEEKGDHHVSYFWDPISKARYYHQAFVEKRDGYLKWANDPTRYKKRYLYRTIRKLSDKRDVYEYLNTSKFTDAGGFEVDEMRLVSNYEEPAAELAKVLDGGKFRSFLCDAKAAGNDQEERAEEILAELCDRLHEAGPGKEYLYKVYRQDDSFLNKSVFGTTRKATNAGLELLEVLSGVIVRVEGDQALVKISSIIQQRTGLTLATVSWSPGESVQHGIKTPNYQEIQVFKKQSAENLAKKVADSEVADRVVAVIELVNLLLAVRTVAQSRSVGGAVKNLLGLAGSVTDFLSGVWVIANKLGRRTVLVLGIVSGAMDAVVATWDMSGEIDTGDYDAAIGEGVEAVGGVVMAVGSYMVITGGTASGTGVGLAPGVFVMFLGAVVGAIGGLIDFLADNDPIDDWVNHCLWGHEYGHGDTSTKWSEGPFKSWKGDLDKQIRALHNILYRFTLEAEFTSDERGGTYCTVHMIPSMIHDYSVVRLDVDVQGPTGHGNARDFTPWQPTTVEEKNGRIVKLSGTWHPPIEVESVEVKAQIDVFGDGTLKYPADGDVETKTIDEWF